MQLHLTRLGALSPGLSQHASRVATPTDGNARPTMCARQSSQLKGCDDRSATAATVAPVTAAVLNAAVVTSAAAMAAAAMAVAVAVAAMAMAEATAAAATVLMHYEV